MCGNCRTVQATGRAARGAAELLNPTPRTAALQLTIVDYISAGYRLMAQTETSAWFVQPKRFSVIAFVLLLLLGVLPGLGYLLWFRGKRDLAVEITVDEDGKLHRRTVDA
jgi:hypothetical protein